MISEAGCSQDPEPPALPLLKKVKHGNTNCDDSWHRNGRCACLGLRSDDLALQRLYLVNPMEHFGVLNVEYLFDAGHLTESASLAKTTVELQKLQPEIVTAAERFISEKQQLGVGLYYGHGDCLRSVLCGRDDGCPDHNRACKSCHVLQFDYTLRRRVIRPSEFIARFAGGSASFRAMKHGTMAFQLARHILARRRTV